MAVSNFSGNSLLSNPPVPYFYSKNQIPIKPNTEIKEESLTYQDYKEISENHFARISKKYPHAYIEKLAYKILQDPSIIPFVKNNTLLKDTLYHRIWKIRTPLGEALYEWQNAKESLYRKLLDKDTFAKADKEAKELLDQIDQKDETILVKIGEEFQVNTNKRSILGSSAIATLESGRQVIVWLGSPNGSFFAVYGQMYNADGTRIGNEFQITPSLGQLMNPTVVGLEEDKFAVIWGTHDQGIYVQIYNADRTKKGDQFQINAPQNPAPATAYLGHDTFAIVWGSTQSNYDIYCQIINANGTKIGEAFQINTYTSPFQRNPSVAYLGNNTLAAAWDGYSQSGSDYGFAQIFNADGTKIGKTFQVNTHLNYQGYPTIAALNEGRFVIAYPDQDESGDGIFAQIFNENGEKVGKEFQVNTYTIDNQQYPKAVKLSNGYFAIVWQNKGQDFKIFAQIFNENGEKVGKEFQVNTYSLLAQVSPAIASSFRSKFTITWRSRSLLDGSYIAGQTFKNNQIPIVQNPIPDQTIEHNSLWNYTIKDTFLDKDGDPLALTATQPDRQPLPSWAKFNPKTGNFLGTPLKVFSLFLRVTANDSFKGITPCDFKVTSTNTPPIVQNPIPNLICHNKCSYTFSKTTFFDQDGDKLTYSATFKEEPLPEEITFNAITRTFSVIPININSYLIKVAGDDGFLGIVYANFTILTPNTSPRILHPIPDLKIKSGENFIYIISDKTFIDEDGDPLALTATQCGKKEMPKNIYFNEKPPYFYGKPTEKGSYSICVMAKDNFPKSEPAVSKSNIEVTPSTEEKVHKLSIILSVIGGILGVSATVYGFYKTCYQKCKNKKTKPPEANSINYLPLQESNLSING